MNREAAGAAEIAVVPATDALAEEIETQLTKALRANVPPNDVASIAVIARDGDGALIAGLAARPLMAGCWSRRSGSPKPSAGAASAPE